MTAENFQVHNFQFTIAVTKEARNMNTFIRFILAAALAATAIPTMAGNLTPPGAPGAGSGMPTTKAIFQQLSSGTVPAPPGVFQGPSAGPTGGTGRRLSEIKAKLPAPDNTNGAASADVKAGKTFWGLRTDGTWGAQTGSSHIATIVCQPHWAGANCDVCTTHSTGVNCVCDTHFTGANCDVCIARWNGANCDVCTNGWSGANCDVAHPAVNKTGQAISYATGDDGYYKYGIAPAVAPTVGITGAYNSPALINSPRFTDNGNGTVTDNQTSLIWLKNANCFGINNWSDALAAANTLVGNNTQCNLNDGSSAGQWRIPNINELHSLGPTWPPSTPFTSVVQNDYYWSSSTYAIDTSTAWYVYTHSGYVGNDEHKYFMIYVWPVRSGQ
jgi:hypothetical protein